MEQPQSAHTESLLAEKLVRDPRIAQAKALIAEALKEQQEQLKGIRPPHPDRKEAYKTMIECYSSLRGVDLWYPYLGSGIGNGPLVELMDGSVKYDFIGGIGVHYFGHSHPAIVNASIDAAINDTTMQGNLQQNGDSLALTELLLEASGLDHCFLTSSGSMANENALKIIFQNRHPANRLLAFDNCFTGRTLAIAAITDKPAYRQGLPTCINVDYVPFFNPDRPVESREIALETLKYHLQRYPGQHAGMIFELVQGEGGIYPGDTPFFMALIEELKKQGIKVFIDEVQTFGRLPALFAFQHFQLQDYVDVVTIGKLSQVCATLYRKDLKTKPGLLSQTFTSSSAQIRTGFTIIRSLIDEGYFGPSGKIQSMHDYFIKGLKEIEKRHPKLLSGPWGLGAMIAFTPFSGEANKVLKLSQRLFDAGVICFTTGHSPSRIRFLIPMGAIREKDIDEVLTILEHTLTTHSE